MTSSRWDLPQDLDACHATIIAQSRVLAEKDEQIAEMRQTSIEQQATIDRLGADLALLKRALFGSRRERYSEDPQQKLLFDAIELQGAKPSPPTQMSSSARS